MLHHSGNMVSLGHAVFTFTIVQVFSAPGDLAGSSSIRSTVTSSMWTVGSSWAAPKASSSDPIVFPDSKEDLNIPPLPNLSVKPCPNGQKFCDDDDNYPSAYLKKLPREVFESFNHFFLNDTLTDLDNGLATRIDGYEEQSLCISREELYFPKKAEAIDKETKLIVNTGEYLQGVRVELCLNESAPCLFKEAFPQGYTTVCRQKYIARKLVVVSKDNQQRPLSTSDFLMPSCCVCKVQRTGRFR